MAQANSNDSDTNDNSDISSQLSEIKESYERRTSELHHEFSQLKDLMMAIVNKIMAKYSHPVRKVLQSRPNNMGSTVSHCSTYSDFKGTPLKTYVPKLKCLPPT